MTQNTPEPTNTPAEQPQGSLTQADVDRIVADRLTRERAKFADYDDLKAKAAKAEELEAAGASDLEKAVKAARTEGAQSVIEAANQRLVRAEARALAAEERFRNPTLATRALDLSSVKVDANGDVDSSAIKALLKGLADENPYLVDDGKSIPKPDPSQGPGGGGKPSAVEEGLAQARKRFGTPAGSSK